MNTNNLSALLEAPELSLEELSKIGEGLSSSFDEIFGKPSEGPLRSSHMPQIKPTGTPHGLPNNT